MTTVPCPYCSGNQFILENRNGEGYVPCKCEYCIGTGFTVAPHVFYAYPAGW